MLQIKANPQIFLKILIYFSAEYKKTIAENYELTQMEKRNLGYLPFSKMSSIENTNFIKAEYPFDVFSIIRINPHNFWEIVFQNEAFDLAINYISDMLDKDSINKAQKNFVLKISKPTEMIKFGTIFSNDEKINEEKSFLFTKTPQESNVSFEENWKTFLKLNFPINNIKAHEIFIKNVVVGVNSYATATKNYIWVHLTIDIYFDFANITKTLPIQGSLDKNNSCEIKSLLDTNESLPVALNNSSKEENRVFNFELNTKAQISIEDKKELRKELSGSF